jgi:hypothetical protein
VIVSVRPPLPPVTRVVEPITTPRARVVADDPHTIPGWVGALIYLALLVVVALLVGPRLPELFG